MKTKICIALGVLVGLLSTGPVTATEKVDTLKWTFNRTNNTITFTFPVTNNWYYTLVRYDIKNKYYDSPTNWMSTVTGIVTFTIDPFAIHPDNEGMPTPSGQCLFYMVKQTYP